MENYTYAFDNYGNIMVTTSGDKITEIKVVDEVNNGNNKENRLHKEAYRQLKIYFQGNLKVFDLPLEIKGTPFQEKVWQELLKIPYGITITYKDLAQSVGGKNYSRAVGNANNKNKLMIVVPCHRVIGSNKALVGYAGGISLKEKLLKLEAKHI